MAWRPIRRVHRTMSRHRLYSHPATRLQSVGTAEAGPQGSVEHYGASRGILGRVVVCKLHTRPGRFIYGWTVSARSVVTTPS